LRSIKIATTERAIEDASCIQHASWPIAGLI
jgi:hypothetical protein